MSRPLARLAVALACACLAAVALSASVLAAPSRSGVAPGIGEAVPGLIHAETLMPRAAEEDSTLEGFLRTLSDSTDTYFGMSAAPLDTFGLDSARAYSLQNPGRERMRGTLRPRIAPSLAFNRVDGPVYGATVSIGQLRRMGRLDANGAYAVGPNDPMGYGKFSKVIRHGASDWEMELWAGRETANMDPDRGDFYLASLRAFVNGSDSRNYLRRDGVKLSTNRIGPNLDVGFGARDQLETPRATTTTWNLMGWEPQRIENLQAAEGRAIELSMDALWRVPHTPFALAGAYASSARALGSDFEYRRLLLAAGADVGLGRVLSVVPQVCYGSLTGDALPQESFYIGGPRTLRSVPTQSLGGTRMALARVDVIGIHDLLALVRLPHPDAFPIQGAVFAGLGAAWGPDPYGGPDRGGGDWPNVEEWKSEAGFSLMYQPGIPDPLGFIRFSYAWPLGPKREEDRISISYSRAFDLMRPFDR